MKQTFLTLLLLLPALSAAAGEATYSAQNVRKTLLNCSLDTTRIVLSQGITDRAHISARVKHRLLQDRTCTEAAARFYDLKQKGEVDAIGQEEISAGLDAGYHYLQNPKAARTTLLNCLIRANRQAVEEGGTNEEVKKRAQILLLTRERCLSAASACSHFEARGRIKKITVEEISSAVKAGR